MKYSEIKKLEAEIDNLNDKIYQHYEKNPDDIGHENDTHINLVKEVISKACEMIHAGAHLEAIIFLKEKFDIEVEEYADYYKKNINLNRRR